MKQFILLLALSGLTGSAVAQEMPVEPPAELKALAWQNGDWEGTVKWSMPGMEGDSVMAFKVSFEGPFQKSVSTMEMQGMKMIETGYLAWDAAKKEFVMWTFTNFAPMPRVERGHLNKEKMVMTSDPWEVMGQTMVSRATMTKKSDKEMSFVLEFKMGDSFTKAAEGSFKKK